MEEEMATMMGSYGWMGGFGGAGGFGMFVGALVWLAIIVLLVWGVGGLFGRRTTDARTDALEILRNRFATGEITAPEFEIARRALVGPTVSPQMEGTN
jgi:putative membrane protein